MDGRSAWKELIKKYADGRPICNCGDAYYSTGGQYWVVSKNGMTEHNDGLYCKWGCQCAQSEAKEYVALKIVEMWLLKL